MNDISVQNAPRDIGSLTALKMSTLYRLAHALQIFADNDAELGFAGGSQLDRAQAIAAGLQRLDESVGAPPAPVQMPQQAPQQMQMQMPQQAPQPVQMQMQMPQQAPQQMQMPQQAQPPNNLPPAPSMGQPVIPVGQPTMPNLQPPHAAVQMPMQAPMQMPQQAAVNRQPSTQTDPTNSGAQPAALPGATPAVMEKYLRKIAELSKKVHDAGEQTQEWVEEIHEQQRYLHHVLRVILRLQVYMATETLQLDSLALAKMVQLDTGTTATSFLEAFPDEEEAEEEEEPTGN